MLKKMMSTNKATIIPANGIIMHCPENNNNSAAVAVSVRICVHLWLNSRCRFSSSSAASHARR
jgi:hypothetical protein